MKAEIQALIEDSSHESVGTNPLGDLRDMRSKCQSAESDVSLVRRLTQGRLDIVGHEVSNRSGDSASEVDVSTVLYELPDILADASGGSRGRVGQLDPGPYSAGLINELDSLVTPAELSGLASLEDGDVNRIFGSLQDFETELSTSRRALHEKIDAIQLEIGRRYRDGEAGTADAFKQ